MHLYPAPRAREKESILFSASRFFAAAEAEALLLWRVVAPFLMAVAAGLVSLAGHQSKFRGVILRARVQKREGKSRGI